MTYLAIVLAVLSASLYFLGPWVVALILVPFFILAKLFLRWLGVALVVLALGAPAVSRADLLDDVPECQIGDCELVNHPAHFGCIGSDAEECRWNTLDYGLQGGFLTLMIADWVLTSQAIRQNRPGWYETNPIEGRHPSQGTQAAYSLTCMAGHTLISMVLPKPWRTIWQSVWIGVQGGVMVRWGTSVYFPF